MNVKDLQELWERELADEALSPAEREALDEAIETDARFRAERREETWIDGTLRAMGGSGKTADAFVRTACDRMRTEQDAARFVESVASRARAMRSAAESEPGRHEHRKSWAHRPSVRILAAAAGLLVVVGVWLSVTPGRGPDAAVGPRPRLAMNWDPAQNQIRVSFDGARGWKYWVEFADRLGDAEAWQAVPGAPSVNGKGGGRKLEILIPDGQTAAARFFRVKGVAL